jgi:hypothetical protein
LTRPMTRHGITIDVSLVRNLRRTKLDLRFGFNVLTEIATG